MMIYNRNASFNGCYSNILHNVIMCTHIHYNYKLIMVVTDNVIMLYLMIVQQSKNGFNGCYGNIFHTVIMCIHIHYIKQHHSNYAVLGICWYYNMHYL